MKALRFEKFGGLDVLEVAELPRPVPQAGEVLVAIRAASINPSDVKNVAGKMEGTTLPRTPGRDFAGYVADGLGFRIGYVGGEGDEKTHVEAAARFVEGAGEAVEDAAQAGGAPVALDYFQTIGPGFAAVDYYWQLGGSGLFELAAEYSLLKFGRYVVVVIIEAHLAPGYYSRVLG